MRPRSALTLVVLLAAVAAAFPAAAAAKGGGLASIHWEKRVKAAERVVRSREGKVSFSLRGGGVKRSRDGTDRYHSASVVKAMLLVAYLKQNRHRELDHGERNLLKIMIRRSDNDAATTVRNIVGNGALEELADDAGFHCFATSSSSWGSTEICSRDMALYMKSIEAMLPKRHRDFAMRLLRTIVAKQRWGFAEVTGKNWTPYFKGGWYDDAPGDWRVHQIALLRGPQGAELGLAVLTAHQPSKKYGIETIRRVANALVGPVVR